MKKYNFSFHELVLVFACSAVIAALTVAAAKSAADPQITACADNIRNLEKKFVAWEENNDGRMIFVNVPKKGIWGRRMRDSGYFEPDGYYGNNRNYPKKFQCPSETRERNNSVSVVKHPSVNVGNLYDYGLNGHVNMKPSKNNPEALKRSDIKMPAKTMHLTEGVNYAILNRAEFGTARHGEGKGNTLFFDGHIEFVENIPFKGTKNYFGRFWFN